MAKRKISSWWKRGDFIDFVNKSDFPWRIDRHLDIVFLKQNHIIFDNDQSGQIKMLFVRKNVITI